MCHLGSFKKLGISLASVGSNATGGTCTILWSLVPKWEKRVTVDRTFLLNSAYEEIREQKWWIRPDAHLIDNGEFYAHMKAPSRVRDLTTGELRYRWTETGALDHYRFAHAFDHLDGAFRKFIGVFELI